MKWSDWFFVMLGVITLLFALYKWVIVRNDKRRGDLKDAHDRTLQEHAERLDRHSARLSKMDELITLTRDEMHESYPKLDRIEKMEASIDSKIERVHSRLTAVSRDVNQAIGTIKANHENEITHLVAQIRDAIGSSHD
ncbi:hypothetical protein FHP88_15650 [Sedimenticola selenatireducens]|uniref:Uncharacterized protein n=1 Tax=Sedimenticola selenatireducens TaxID=191960 RepID=A0A557S0K9_9GAMM|nr:hypothetical protein [Sedimenticola selenatireducens]TVO70887.1 hypothetical protein FHP88_15650 [Sedimenticola selenatireducens]